MAQKLQRILVPVAALVAGLVAATYIGNQLVGSDAGAYADVAERFSQLSSAEQERLLNRTEEFRTLRETQPAEWNRIQSLHTAAQEEPELRQKLESFHGWWTSLDRLQQQRLRNPDRTFVEDWPSAVKLVYTENDIKRDQIAVGFPVPESDRDRERQRVWKYSEQSFQLFLDDVLPSPLPNELQNKLTAFSDDCEVTLTKILWLLREIDNPFRGRPPGQQPSKSIPLDRVRRAALDHLVPSELVRSIETRLRQDRPEESDRWTAFVTFRFIGAGVDHYKEEFRSKYLRNSTEDLVAVFEDMEREDQLMLMGLDGKDSQNALRSTLLRKVHQENPAVASLASDLDRASRELFMFLPRPSGGRGGGRGGPGSGRSRSGFGRPRDGGPDNRRGDGPDDRRGGGPDERRGDGRDGYDDKRRGEERPGNDHFRPPADSGRKFEQRPPERKPPAQ